MRQTFIWWALVNEVHDGDTFYGPADQGAGITNGGLATAGMGFRLYGCNAHELHLEDGKTPNPAGVAARDNLAALIPVGSKLRVETMAWDKWQGRVDVAVTVPGIGDLVDHLVAHQWVAPGYYGTGPKPVPPWPRTVA